MSQKRLRASLNNNENTTTGNPPKRLKMAFSGEEFHSSNLSFDSFDSENEHHEDLPLRLSYHANANVTLRTTVISMRQNNRKAHVYQAAPTDDEVLRSNILAYNPKARRPTFDLDRPAAQEQLINDFRHIEHMTWCLICEYSKICFDLQTRYDAVNAIQNYLTRNINTTMLPNIYENSCYEMKSTALSTLTKIIFSTLSDDPAVNRINGLLHARVCDLLGDAMVKVTDAMSEDDIRYLVQEKELFQRMKELQKLVANMRWPIDGLETVIELFQGFGGGARQGRLSSTLRHSLQLFRKGSW